MGMDGVEIVMETEDAFGITIEDGEAEKIRTPGQLIDLVISKVSTEGAQPCTTRRAFHRLRRALIVKLGIERRRIRPDTRLDSLIPLRRRRERWSALAAESQSAKWPDLAPGWAPCVLGMVAGTAVTAWARLHWLLGFSGALGIWALGTIMFMIVAVRMWRPINWAFPANCRTVSDLALFYVKANPELKQGGQRVLAKDEVASIVRKIVRDVLAVDDFDDDDDFVKDLGLS